MKVANSKNYISFLFAELVVIIIVGCEIACQQMTWAERKVKTWMMRKRCTTEPNPRHNFKNAFSCIHVLKP